MALALKNACYGGRGGFETGPHCGSFTHRFFLTPRPGRCYKSVKSEALYQKVNIKFTGLEAKLALYPVPRRRGSGEVLRLPEEYSV